MTKISNLYSLTNYITANTSGNIVISAPSSGYALDVTGTGRFTGALSVSSSNTNFVTTLATAYTYAQFRLQPNSGTSSGLSMGLANPNVLYVQSQYSDGTSTNPLAINPYGGNVGIGTSSPTSALHVLGTSSAAAVFASTSSSSFYTTYRYNTSTDVGYIGNGSGVATGASSTDFGFQSIGSMVFAAGGGTERMRINSGGDVKFALNITFGTTSEMYIGRGNAISGAYNSYDFVMANFQTSGRVVINASTSGSSGVYLAQGSNSWAAWSDERMKTDLSPIENGIEKVSQLRALTGRYKTDEESKKRSFLIAQDVLSVLPEATDLDENTGMYAVQYTDVIPLLVASIKELSAKVTALENK